MHIKLFDKFKDALLFAGSKIRTGGTVKVVKNKSGRWEVRSSS